MKNLKPIEALRKYWGYKEFRPMQEQAVNAVLEGRDVMIILPTGGGKSLCYQLPSACGIGLTVVISPLIALMDDQVSQASNMGLNAAALHSQMPEKDKRRAYAMLNAGELNLLYISPERLAVGDLNDIIKPYVGLFAVDEAHCISQWGHEFRPEYRQLAQFLKAFPNVPRMALTATATPKVQKDIEEQLELQDAEKLIGYPDRPNLTYRSFYRYDQNAQVLDIIRHHLGEGGIVYAQTRKEVEKITKYLKKAGVSCAAYHAGLSAKERASAQNAFIHEETDVVVATVAFGMGINRSNVRFVIHANTPRSIEHYQQEAGRAGRDGEPAECVLLFSARDLIIHKTLSMREEEVSPQRKAAIERQLSEIGRYAVSPICRHKLLTEHFGCKYPPSGAVGSHDCGACDVCLNETKEMAADEALLIAQKIISAVYRTGNCFGAAYVTLVLKGSENQRVLDNKHNLLKVFGLLKDESEKSIRNWIDQLVVQGLLDVTEGEYPLLKVTRKGLAACKGLEEVHLGKPAVQGVGRRRKSAAPVAVAPDGEMFARLKRLRLLIARRIGKPPFIVFSDASLTDMCAKKPQNLEEMLDVKGVGEMKLSLYGEAFLMCIQGSEPEVAELCFRG